MVEHTAHWLVPLHMFSYLSFLFVFLFHSTQPLSSLPSNNPASPHLPSLLDAFLIFVPSEKNHTYKRSLPTMKKKYNKTRKKPCNKADQGNPTGRKISLEQEKPVRVKPTPTFRSPTKKPSSQQKHINRLVQTPASSFFQSL